MKRARTNSVSYQGTKKNKFARGTKGNPIVLEQRVSRAVNRAVSRVTEKKGMDTTLSLTAGNVLSTTNTNGAAFVLNLIQTGNGSWNRVGRKAHLKSLRINGLGITSMTPDATTGQVSDNQIRMVVVWDKQPSSGTIPTYDDIFGTTVQDGTEAVTNIFNPPKYDNMDRFRVIRDKVIDLEPKAVNAAGTPRNVVVQEYVDEYIKLGNLETVFSGQSSPMTIADISTGALYVYFRSWLNVAGQNQAIVNMNARLRYTD